MNNKTIPVPPNLISSRNNELMHYGTPHHSGRYPWGSGDRPYQGDGQNTRKAKTYNKKKIIIGVASTAAIGTAAVTAALYKTGHLKIRFLEKEKLKNEASKALQDYLRLCSEWMENGSVRSGEQYEKVLKAYDLVEKTSLQKLHFLRENGYR